MAETSIDPAGFFEFDLSRGQVRTRGGDRVLLLSDSAMAPLVSAAVRSGDLTAVRKLGRELGDVAASSLSRPVASATPEEVLGAAAGMLSLFGWGQLDIERWGDALVARVRDLPELDDDHLAVAALLGGLFSALSQREVACVPIANDLAFLAVDPQIAEQVWKWSRSGAGLGSIVERLERED